jgi:RNA polymerase sigma-70 factor (ECF subfamily)
MNVFCRNCGAELPDNAKFCGMCGQSVTQAGEDDGAQVAALVTRMQKGDDNAFAELFDKTKGYVAACVRLQNVPEASIDDIVQEVYVKVYRSVGSIENPHAALGWMKRIAYNASLDYHRKNARHVEDVSIEDEAGGHNEFEGIMNSPDEVSRLPENVIESADVRNILLGFVGELPDEQRTVFFAHFLNEMSAVDIARANGINESTVRSRILRARRALQDKIDAYAERTGVQLRSFSVAPVLWMLLQQGRPDLWSVNLTAASLLPAAHASAAVGAAAHTETVAKAASDTAQSAKAASGTAKSAKAASGTAKSAKAASGTAKSTGWLASHKAAVAAIVAIAVIAGAGGAYVALNSGNDASEQAAEAPAQEEEQAPAFDEAAMAQAYEAVLKGVASGAYDFSNPNFGFATTPITDGSTSCRYALQDIDGDGHPELLVEQPQRLSSEPTVSQNMLAFTYKSGDAAEQLSGAVTLPTSTSAGYAGQSDVYVNTSGTGLYKRIYTDSGTPGISSTGTISLATLTVQGSSLVETALDGTDTPSDMGEKIAFTDISDLSALRRLEGESGEEAGASSTQGGGTAKAAQSSAKQRYADAVAAYGKPVWEGTIRVLSFDELGKLQLDRGDISQADYKTLVRDSKKHVVLLLDSPVSVTAANGGGPGTRSGMQDMIELEKDAAGWQAYDGKHVAIAVAGEKQAFWPSDASLPIGVVRAHTTAADSVVASY